MTCLAVLTTLGTLEDARRLARALVERKLAACAQISEIESCYQWQGAVQTEREYRLLLKTTSDRYDQLEAALLSLHPYELPAVCAIEFERVSAPFGEWVAKECGD